MQPVWVIPKAIEIVQRRHPRRLVTPQACAEGVKVPLQPHGPYGQTRAVGGAVPIAHGVEPPVLVLEQPIDGKELNFLATFCARQAVDAWELQIRLGNTPQTMHLVGRVTPDGLLIIPHTAA